MLKAAGIYFFARVLAAALALVGVAIYTRVATPEVYGVYTLVWTGAVALFGLFFAWLRGGILRFLPAEDGKRSATVGAALGGYLLGAGAVAVIALGAVATGSGGLPAHLVLLGAGLLVAYGWLELVLAVVQAKRRPGAYALLTLGRAALGIALGSALVIAGYGAAGLLCGILVAHVLPSLAISLRYFGRIKRLRVEPATLHKLAVFGLPLALTGLAASLVSMGDRYLLAYLVDVETAGFYAAPYDLSQRTLHVLMLSAFLACSPLVFRGFERGEGAWQGDLCRQGQLMLLTALPAATLLAAGAPLVARILFGEAFRESAVQLMPWIVAAALLQGLQTFYMSYAFTLSKRTLANAAVVLGGAALNMVLNLWLIPRHGAVGAAVATLISYGAVFAVSFALSKRWVALPWPVEDAAKILAVCALAAPLVRYTASRPDLLTSLLASAAVAGSMGLALLAIDAAGLRVQFGKLVARLRGKTRPVPASASQTEPA